ncbi:MULTISPECIES: TcpQ domain-containing protein [unclassified Pseudomonas]|uniref:PFGI-1 class ICE element type IV pilus protein PilL2 n=1 Tax=unclassified Pseudomonas TaxID=196821 RepID=UPI0004ADAD1C|nr:MULTISPECIES: TcpQ domain-containing protein [unclassified Pseudomonas]SMF20397.1 type IV pili sensor histidine kinase and response regulator [Pseudomonas sp. LAMO17WK12:I1]
MIRHVTTLSLLALIASCTTQTAQTPKPAFDSSRNPDMLAPDLYPSGAVPEKEPVVRYGRYTLVSTLPDSGQRDLMAQIIDISIPANMHPNVHDAMQYVVDRSGYTLCSAETGHVNILYTRPLPAAQYKLGPMTLRNTLQVLAGPAWQVKVDEVNRQVCYVLRPGYQLPDFSRPASTQVAQLNAHSTAQTVAATTVSNDSAGQVVIAAVQQTTPFTKNTTVSASVTNTSSPKPMPSPAVPPKEGATKQTSALPAPSSASSKSSSSSNKSAAAATPATPAIAAPITVTPAIAATAATKPLAQIWTASTGSSLRQTVEGWAEKAHWRLIWQTDDLDYPIDAPLRFEGSFEEAIREIFPLYDSAPRSFVVDGSSSQMLIYIAERKK